MKEFNFYGKRGALYREPGNFNSGFVPASELTRIYCGLPYATLVIPTTAILLSAYSLFFSISTIHDKSSQIQFLYIQQH